MGSRNRDLIVRELTRRFVFIEELVYSVHFTSWLGTSDFIKLIIIIHSLRPIVHLSILNNLWTISPKNPPETLGQFFFKTCFHHQSQPRKCCTIQ